MRASKLEEDAPKRPSLCEFDRRDRASGAIRRSSHRVSSRNASSAAPSIGCATDPFKAYLATLMVIGSELLALPDHCAWPFASSSCRACQEASGTGLGVSFQWKYSYIVAIQSNTACPEAGFQHQTPYNTVDPLIDFFKANP